ncbi:MAG: sugar kinase [Cryobacterium sp.]|nr:sugar kinase [Cryobacterium sp.]
MSEELPLVVAFGETMVVFAQEKPGELEKAESFRRSMGGAEANVAIALAAEGCRVKFVGKVGDDGFGRYILSELSNLGVNVEAVQIDSNNPTGVYFKEIGAGEPSATNLGSGNSRMHYYRAGSAASKTTPADLDIQSWNDAFGQAALVHLTGITSAISEGARLTQRSVVNKLLETQSSTLSGSTRRPIISFDLNWRDALWRDRESEGHSELAWIAANADLVFLGKSEGIEVFDTSDPFELRKKLSKPRWLVVKSDAEAAVMFDRDEGTELVPGQVEVREAIGAGDAFAAGVIAALLEGASSFECLARGHEFAARALTTSGDNIGKRTAG